MQDVFKLKVGDGVREIKMTYGLLNVLCRTVGDIDGAAQIELDHALRVDTLVELLSERDARGEIVDPLIVFNLEASPDDLAELLTWAQGHVLDFFVKAAERAQSNLLPLVARLTDLKRTLNGGVV